MNEKNVGRKCVIAGDVERDSQRLFDIAAKRYSNLNPQQLRSALQEDATYQLAIETRDSCPQKAKTGCILPPGALCPLVIL